MNEWHDIWGTEWFRIQQPGTWEEELRHDVRDCTSEELIRAVRDMKFDPRTKDRPTLKDLRIRLYVNRKKDRTGGEDVDKCEACTDGWLTTRRPDDTWVSLPCACAMGAKWREKYTEPNEREGMLAIAKRVIKKNVRDEEKQIAVGMKLKAEGWTVDSVLKDSPLMEEPCPF